MDWPGAGLEAERSGGRLFGNLGRDTNGMESRMEEVD